MKKQPHARTLIGHAIAVGMPVPGEYEFELEDCRETFPRFYLFCRLNLPRLALRRTIDLVGLKAISFAELRRNARGIADMKTETVNNMILGLPVVNSGIDD